MKTHYLLLVITFVGVNFLLTGLPARSQDISKQKPAFMSGSKVKLEDVIPKVDIILIGTIEDLGVGVLKAAGSIQYHSVKVDVVKVLLGSVSPKITVHLWLISQGNTYNESEPDLGKPYIFFIDSRTDHELQVWKLLEATDDNVSKVKALIAAAPASK